MLELRGAPALSPFRRQKLLNKLLTYGPSVQSEANVGVLFLVVPRPGTISPWSSKASDIAKICGLTKLKRIERGIAYYVRTPAKLTLKQRQTLSNIFYDRMTQAVFHETAGAELLFSNAEPKPLSTVDA